MIDEIKHHLDYYEETVDSTDANRLYFLKQHTLVDELYFNEDNETYSIKGYKNKEGRKIMEEMTKLIEEVETTLAPFFKDIENCVNQSRKVLDAFHHVKATESDLQGSTGYGYDDFGRDHLEEIYAHTFKAEDALVRPQIISGTHAITLALQSTFKIW